MFSVQVPYHPSTSGPIQSTSIGASVRRGLCECRYLRPYFHLSCRTIIPSRLTTSSLLSSPMTEPTSTPTSHAIVKTVHASMRLVGGSSELLTVSQLLTVKSDLRKTLAIVNGQIQAAQSGTPVENLLKAFANVSHVSQMIRS